MANDKSLELQIRIASEEALRAITSLQGEIKALANEAKKFATDEGESLEKSFKEAEAAAKDTSMSIGDIKKAIGSLAEVVAATKALSVIKDMGAFALKTADDFQTMRNQFGTLLGDMEAGAGLFNEIKAFGDKTPFDLSTLTQATNVLISAKVPLNEMNDQLAKFGDLSQGNAQRFSSYINAFSQASAKGKADMQILNTYLNQGVPILDALAKNFGKTTAEVVEMSSQGKISFEEFSKALDDLTASGGQYFGGMELASQSLASMQEGLQESVNSLSASFGEMLLPAAVAVVGALTAITNAINESPLLKGLLTGAIITLTGYLAAMAVQAGISFVAQMKLNLAVGVLRPSVLATTLAVAGLAAGYTVYAANCQQAARDAEEFAYQQKKQTDTINDATNSIAGYNLAVSRLAEDEIRQEISRMNAEIEEVVRGLNQETTLSYRWTRVFKPEELDFRKKYLASLYEGLGERRTSFIDTMFGGSDAVKIQKINEQLAMARKYLTDPNLSGGEESQLHEIIRNLNAELEKLLNKGNDINGMAAQWKKAWAEFYGKWRTEQMDDPFAVTEYERRKKIEDAWNNYVRDGNKEVIDQVNEYYNAQRGEVIRQLAGREESMQRQTSRTKIDDMQHEFEEAIKAINELEAHRIIAAGNSEKEIAAIRERFSGMRGETIINYQIEIEKTQLDEARESVKNWQEELSDDLLTLLMNLEMFGDKAAVVLSGLSAQLIELSATSALSGFEEFGRALGEGEDAADSLQRALAAMSRQILQQLPRMFLQAGLQLIANGQWPLGLGFIAAAGSSAIISGYVQGATGHAQGGVFDEYGKSARAFAAGGAFTNQVVSQPTYFRYGGGLGVMGEAGPEAILPLKRMPSGNLGVESGGNNGTVVVVNVINNSREEIRREESTDAGGNKQIDVIIGTLIDSHISSGKADRAMARYGLRAAGV